MQKYSKNNARRKAQGAEGADNYTKSGRRGGFAKIDKKGGSKSYQNQGGNQLKKRQKYKPVRPENLTIWLDFG